MKKLIWVLWVLVLVFGGSWFSLAQRISVMVDTNTAIVSPQRLEARLTNIINTEGLYLGIDDTADGAYKLLQSDSNAWITVAGGTATLYEEVLEITR